MTPFPVIKHSNWRFLLRDIDRAFSFITQLDSRRKMAALAAPVAIARWIAEQKPELAKRSSLNLVIAGAEFFDAINCGAWYGTLPWLLGNTSMRIDVAMVGHEILPEHQLECFQTPRSVRRHPVFRGSLGHYVRSEVSKPIDLVVMFHPGFESHLREWMYEDGVLVDLISTGVPVVGASYAIDEYEMDRTLAECAGLALSEPIINPFFIDLNEEGGGKDSFVAHFGEVLWSFDPKHSDLAPLEEFDAKSGDIDLLSRIQGSLAAHDASFGNAPLDHWESIGREERLPNDPPGQTVIRLFRNLAVRRSSGEVIVITSEKFAGKTPLSLSNDVLATYPVSGSRIDRACWAARVWDADIHPQLDHFPMMASEVYGQASGFRDSPFSGMAAAAEALGIDPSLFTGLAPDEMRVMTDSDHRVFDPLSSGDIETVIQTLAASPSAVNAINQEGQTVLFAAIDLNSIELFDAAIKAGANINHIDREGWSPLIHAANNPHGLPFIEALLQCGPSLDINYATPMGWSALLGAISRQLEDNALCLVKAGANVRQTNAVGFSALVAAQEVPLSAALKGAILKQSRP